VEDRAILPDPRRVGAPAARHVDRGADLQDVAAVERSGALDPLDREPEAADGGLGAGHLADAGRAARAREHRRVAEHHRVLHED